MPPQRPAAPLIRPNPLVNGFVADDRMAMIALQPASDLFGRPAFLEFSDDESDEPAAMSQLDLWPFALFALIPGALIRVDGAVDAVLIRELADLARDAGFVESQFIGTFGGLEARPQQNR